MDWQQKVKACKAIGDIEIKMQDIGDWYINHSGVDRREGNFLCSGVVTNAKTPEEAINQHWEWLLDPVYYIVVNNYKGRHAFRWNGFMWEEVEEDK